MCSVQGCACVAEQAAQEYVNSRGEGVCDVERMREQLEGGLATIGIEAHFPVKMNLLTPWHPILTVHEHKRG